MFKEKTIKVFNTGKNMRGDFVTFCYTRLNIAGEKIDGAWINGLIDDIDEYNITIVTTEGRVCLGIDVFVDDIVRFKE